MKRGFDRTERIADMIQQSVAQVLLQEMADKRFQLVTITGVVVSRDYSYAKIYVSIMTEEKEKIKEIIEALNRAAKKMRYHLARDIQLRIVPTLKFIYDESTAHGFKLSRLIDAAMKKSDHT